MSRTLSLTRAARLVGVPRGTLQRMIAQGQLSSFDGSIVVEELQRRFPRVAIQDRLDETGALERVGKIREEAFARRMREIVLPSQEVLAQRLFRLSVELSEVQRHLQSYHALLVELRAKIEACAPGDDVRADLLQELDRGLQRVLAIAPDPFQEKASMLEAASAHVTVRPSGHQFLVEGSDSLLQAGLKAGLPLGYGCGTGTCGLCKARIVSGEVRAISHADYRLSEQEKEQGICLLCNHTAVSDVVLETLEAAGPGDIPVQQVLARVRAVTRLSGDTQLLHLQTPRSHRLRFLAGQSVTLGLAAPGGDIAESMPLASCPCDERNLLFHVAGENPGPLSRMIAQSGIRIGDELTVRGPFGEFVLGPDGGHAPLFLACDIGFAPTKSLVEQAIALDEFESISLYWLTTRPGGHYLENLCRSWADGLDHFQYVSLVDTQAAQGARQVAARVLTDHGNLPACAVYVAGPAPFVDTLRDLLCSAGVPRDRIALLAT